MVRVVIFTMVKNEDDIIREWIEYHGNIFGYASLFIIDNFSTDRTFEICKEYISKGIHLTQKDDYKKKGEYTTICCKNTKCDIFIPLDIDEFIIYYNKDNKTVHKSNIIPYLENLLSSNNGIYKMNYLWPLKTNNNDNLSKFSHCIYSNHFSGDVQNYGKTFVIKKNIPDTFTFDHGNHVPVNNYLYSELQIIHFHHRSHEQLVKKIKANVIGLGYTLEINELKILSEKNACGKHHIDKMICLLENPNFIWEPELHSYISNDWICLENLIP